MKDAVKRRSSFNAIHLDTMLKVDVFIPKTRAFDQEEQLRVRQQPLIEDTRPFYVASPEDTVLNKLEWYRMGGEISDQTMESNMAYKTIQTIWRDPYHEVTTTTLNKLARTLSEPVRTV